MKTLLDGLIPGGTVTIAALAIFIAGWVMLDWHWGVVRREVDAAKNERDLAWHKQLNEANQEIERLKSSISTTVSGKDTEIANKLAQAETRHKEEIDEIKRQRADAPLTVDCSQCRIPAVRVLPRTGSVPAGQRSGSGP